MSWKCLIEGILSRMGQRAIFFLPAAKSDLPPNRSGDPFWCGLHNLVGPAYHSAF